MVVKATINHKRCCFHFRISNYRLFSTEHDKLFNPPATIKQIKDFEQEIGKSLPVPFVRYLTELGKGGVGADYGIWSLGVKTDFDVLSAGDIIKCSIEKDTEGNDVVTEVWIMEN